MLRKHIVLLGIILSGALLFIASLYYPGGSQLDPNSIGYDWANNYFSNFFSTVAVNGAPNPSMPWAIAAVVFMCASFAIFFFKFSNRIPNKNAAGVIQYGGVGAMFCGFLIVTPFHDLMITISGTATLVVLFYITVFIFKSQLVRHKVLSVLLLVVAYATNYIYYSQSYLEWLPIMQKVALLLVILWILSLEYFTTREDFQSSTVPIEE